MRQTSLKTGSDASKTYPVTKGQGKIWGTEPNLETTDPKEADSNEDIEKVTRSIFVLQRTRESLSATFAAADSEEGGSFLENALVKQLSIRKAELDNLLPKNVSVIVRSSTPNPEATCEETHEDLVSPHIPGNSLAPEDFSYPLNNLLNGLENQQEGSAPPLPPRHPVLLRVGSASNLANRSAPEVPWTPPGSPRGSEIVRGHSSLQEILLTPEYSPLLAPLLVKPSKMSLVDEAKTSCNDKVRKFNRLIRRYDSDRFPSIDQVCRKEWAAEVSAALEDMVDSIEKMSIEHGQALGTAEVTNWKLHIDDGEDKFATFTSKLIAKANQSQSLDSTRSANASVPQPGSSSFVSNNTDAIKAARADIEVDADIISNEGKDLAEDVNKIDDWSEATDDKVEEYVQKIESWRKRFAKIKERSWSMKRNVKKYDLGETQLTASMALIVTLESELNMAIDAIMFEDETRGIFTLSKSKSADLVLPTFSGKLEEDFSKFQREMLKGFKANKVKKEDQVKKLRENLKGHPLSLFS